MSSGSDNVVELYDAETHDLLDYCDREIGKLSGDGCLLMDGTTPLCTEREFFVDMRVNVLREAAIRRRCHRA